MADKVLEKLVVEIRTDQKKLQAEMNILKSKMGKEGSKLGSMFGGSFNKAFLKVGGIVGIAIAIKKAWNFATVAKNFARDAQEIQSKFDTVFKGMEQKANSWAKEFGGSVGRATSEMKQFAGGLADVLKPLGMTTEEAFETSKQMTKLALDVASFNNRQDADVIHSFTSALTGERESLKTLGIVISEADVKNEAYKSGLAQVGTELTKTAKVQATVNLLFKNSKDAQGDLIRTSSSLANIEKARAAQNKNFMEQLGNETLPTFKVLNEYLMELFTSVENNQDIMLAFGATVKTIGSGLVVLVGSVKGTIDGLVALYKISKAIITNNMAEFYSAQANLAGSWENTFKSTIDSISKMWSDSPLADASGNSTVKDAIKDLDTLNSKSRDTRLSTWLYFNKERGGDMDLSGFKSKSTDATAPKDQWYVDLWQSKGKPALEEEKSMWMDLGQAQATAMGNLISGWTSTISLFKEANSLLEQMIDKFVQIALQQAILAGVNALGGGIAGLFTQSLPDPVIGGASSSTGISSGLSKVNNSIQAMNSNLLSKNMQPTTVVYVGGEKIADAVHRAENRNNRQNVQRTTDF